MARASQAGYGIRELKRVGIDLQKLKDAGISFALLSEKIEHGGFKKLCTRTAGIEKSKPLKKVMEKLIDNKLMNELNADEDE